MKLGELIRRVRTMANDKVEPYFWSDEDITDWLNDAVGEACIRARLIHESDIEAVCLIELEPLRATYPLHPSLYELTFISYQPDEWSRRFVRVILVSTEWLDAHEAGWRNAKGEPKFAIQNNGQLRLVPTPTRDLVLRIEGYRLPIAPMILNDDEADTPEIPEELHLHLIQWALYRGFGIPDMEAFDPTKAELALNEFARFFGLRPDCDLRRITREDVPQHVEAFWP